MTLRDVYIIMRLDKYISSQRTDLSRSDVKKLVRAGKVAVNGAAAKKPEMNVDPADTVEVCGEIVGYNAEAENGEVRLFQFELWSNCKPVDPESYIVF